MHYYAFWNNDFFTSDRFQQPVELAILSALGYLIWWFKSHVGKSNGHGPLNKQAEQLLQNQEDFYTKFEAHVQDEFQSRTKILKEIKRMKKKG